MKTIDELKMIILSEKNTFSHEYWHEFILWLIEEFDFPVEEYFNLDYDDEE